LLLPLSPFSFLKVWRRKVQIAKSLTQSLSDPRLVDLRLLNLGFLSLGQILFSSDYDSQRENLPYFTLFYFKGDLKFVVWSESLETGILREKSNTSLKLRFGEKLGGLNFIKVILG